MFCLDTVKGPDVCKNPIGCSCQFLCHTTCLDHWFQHKQQRECPICHTVSIHVQEEAPPIVTPKRCASLLCILIILWILGFILVNKFTSTS